MRRKRNGSKLKHQVEQAIKEINYIGVSKKSMENDNQETGIHSTTQIKHALSVGQNFAEWAKTQGIRDLYGLKRADYRNYMEYMRERGVSNGHLINVETNLRLLNKGMAKVSESKGIAPRDWQPKTRIVEVATREQPEDRSLTETEVATYYDKLSEGARVGADLQMAFGLRLREAAETRLAHIVERDGRLYWVATSDREALNTAVGVTKAGRGRETPCRHEYEIAIRELIQGKQEADYICPVKYNTLKSAYNRVGMEGSHAFRHTYAREVFREELRERGIEREGCAMVQRMLESREAGNRRDTGILEEEREVYRSTVHAMDRIQAHLGHGKGRMDLAAVYLAGVKA